VEDVLLSARFLLGVFDSVYVISLTAWVGSILFFSFVVAPIVFRVLAAEDAGKFVRALFPRYYAWGTIAGAVALPAYVAGPLCYPEYRGPWVGVQALILLGCIMVMLYAGNSLTPAINAARDAGANGQKRFDRLHRRSVRLNGLVLVVGLCLLTAFANRPASISSGIPELSPQERGQFDDDLDRVIENLETKYGYRRPGPGQPAAVASPGSAVSPDMVKELESYYAQKRQRDLARRRGKAESVSPPGSSPPAEQRGSGIPARESGEH
jgi:hypothetical protein